MSSSKEVAKKPSVLGIMAVKYNLDEVTFLNTIKATVMKPGSNGKPVTNEEVAAFLIVANKYALDPFTNEIYAFPSKKGGVVPIVGIDGFVTIMNRQEAFNGYELSYSEDDKTMDGGKSCPEWAEVKIYHKNREYPTIVREYLDEVYVPARGGYSGPWQSHTKRMLRHKVIIQGIRTAFGITGIYDPDEGERILDAQTVEAGKPEISQPKALETPKKEPEAASTETKDTEAKDIPENEEMNAKAAEIADAFKQCENMVELLAKTAEYKETIETKMSVALRKWLKEEFLSVKKKIEPKDDKKK